MNRILAISIMISVSAAAGEPRPQTKGWSPLRALKTLDRKVSDFGIELSAVKAGERFGSEKRRAWAERAAVELRKSSKTNAALP